MKLALIAAQSENRVIGNGPDIPWKVKGEQALFKKVTMGGALIMGRKTFESIGRPLPDRETIIVTRNPEYTAENCHTADSMEVALELAEGLDRPTFVAGGGELYALALPFADTLHLTTIHTLAEGDVYFPELPDNFKLVSETGYESNIDYTYRVYERRC
ncbi:MAG: dihydrofolate reductase [Pseudomonadales bacterium]|nr:dihydrofolate reductase [Pseudomonadales bacterium]MBO6566846.1 dihydrofolate reductase [Pseudomonadales bacterium]MBO6597671.1 dihydrofolate reductase [Pseudomonadales bacterium]MBO6658028.1 dihydrofolate reductase [Pseudomonadales bacterium]MBO6823909.1 dihydrofolate reductase [Pseudomonadales bacterium]